MNNNNNKNLQHAKNTKDDEFYTTFECVENEVSHYRQFFCEKTVLCNCDDPFESNFSKYFLMNFNVLQLKKLICTTYFNSEIVGTQLPINLEKKQTRHGYALEISRFSSEKRVFTEDEISRVLRMPGRIHVLKGDGDFRSKECIDYLKESDIVVTNPPFSLFSELFSLLIRYNKKFLLIGNQNALTYKDIFPFIRDGLVWTGYRFGEMKFRVPDNSIPHSTRFWVDEKGQKWRSLGNAMWLTNLDNEKHNRIVKLTKHFSPKDYPKYDSFDAINVKNINDIPCDYGGIMGVPITFINRFNSTQFELVGEANHGSDNEFDLFKPTINGKLIFKRILIRNKMPEKIKEKRFRILDLFCGAGGLSYGLEKNPHFSTEVALDFNQQALVTFKKNMPFTETICGDITDESIKQTIINKSKQRGVNMIVGGPPCQGFSLKGKKLGLEDPRNFLFKEYLKIVQSLQPEVFIIENVKALLSTSAGWFKDQIVSIVEKMGYHITYGVLNAADFGVPQLRQRAIFICAKEKTIPLPSKTCSKVTTVREAISDLAYLNSGEGAFEADYLMQAKSTYQKIMRDGSNKLYNHKASNHSPVALKKLSMIPPEKGKEYLPKELLGNQQFAGTWGRLKWDEPSPTIDTRFDAASNGTNNHPFLNRAITPREAARLQSFDDRFIFYGPKVEIRKQIGNAVPPLLAKAIADQIYDYLGGED